jgi:EAL and modified HD-GYP domain-containing signal transduction protein
MTGADQVCVARQPILDARQQVFGYELLYRARVSDTAAGGPTGRASAQLIADALLGVGFDVLTDGRRGFINLATETLLADAGGLLQPEHVVLEILESVRPTKEVVEMCRVLCDRGYAIALDDYVPGTGADELLSFARFAKLDLLVIPPARLMGVAAALLGRGITVIAEKVETVQAFERARAAGCSLFQGYYFCKPVQFSGQTLSASQVTQMRLVAALYKESVSLATIEELLKTDGSLTYRVLRTVNSAGFGLRREIHSIREALLLLGLDQIRRWTSIWLLAGANRGPTELVTMAVLRGRTCELIGQAMGRPDAGAEYFLLGLCSLLDVILGQPMSKVVQDLPLAGEIRAALLGQSSGERRVLDAVGRYEQGAFADAATAAAALGLDVEALANAYAEALKWARGFTGAAARAA